MAVKGVSGLGITGTLSDGREAMNAAKAESEKGKFMSLINKMKQNAEATEKSESPKIGSGLSSSQVSSNHRLNGDYTQGFYNFYVSEADKHAKPEGFAAASTTSKGKKPVIDKTSELYAQSKELENYMVKMMLSSARKTIQKSELFGKNDYARDMYEDMMYDNYAESLTKNSHFGLADQIYIELSGQRG